MSIRIKLLGAAVALMLFVQPAVADLWTFETTFTATPGVVQVGETVTLHLSIALVPDLVADAAAGVTVFGMVFPGVLTITDGAGHSNLDFLILSVSPNNTPTEFTLAVLYQTAGVYFPHFQASGQVSVRTNGTFDTQHPGFVIDGSTQVTAVPGPIAGAGLPGLVFASGGLLAWWRRRRS